MKRTLKVLFAFVMLVMFMGIGQILANNENEPEQPVLLIEQLPTASIRIKSGQTKQGLRFAGKLHETMKNKEHGFYLIYGTSTVDELEAKLENANNQPIYINDKAVFRVVVPGVDRNNEFSIVLTGIPEEGYLDSITVIAFVKENNKDLLALSPAVRSVGEVAIKLSEMYPDSSEYKNIVNQIKDKYVYLKNENGDIVVAKGIYELDPVILKEQFVNDWNDYFDAYLSDMNPVDFFNNAKIGANESEAKDITNSRISLFFNGPYKEKWGWLLNFIESKGVALVNRELNAIKENKVSNVELQQGQLAAYSVANFFNRANEDGGYYAVDFSGINAYANLETYNNKVLSRLGQLDTRYYNEDDTVVLPDNEGMSLLRFKYYECDGVIYYPGDEVVVSGTYQCFKAVYELSDYVAKFFVDGVEIVEFRKTFTQNDEVNFQIPVKAGYDFMGWYDTEIFHGNPIPKLERGSYGDRNFYAKFELSAPEEPEYISITFNLGGASGNVPVQKIEKGTKATKPTNPTREDYEFLGWYLNNVEYNFNNNVNNNITLVARWEKLPDPVDPNQTYTINYVLNGGTLDLAVASGYQNRDEMVVDFLTDFYNFLADNGHLNKGTVPLNTFMHGAGKTSGFDGVYNIIENEIFTYAQYLLNANDKSVNPSTGKFINQTEYNKWVPLLDLVSEYITAINNTQTGWASLYTMITRLKPFFRKQTVWANASSDEATISAIANRIPEELQGSAASGYQNRDEMVVDFLTDFYNFLADKGHLNKASVSLNTFMHGEGKTSGFDGVYNIYEDQAFTYGQYLLNINDKTVNPSTGKFINQPEYNKWVPLLDLVCEYTTAVNPEQTGWASPYTMCSRIKPFFKKQTTWQNADETILTEIVNRIPELIQGGGTIEEAPNSYKASSPDIVLPNAKKAGDTFLGWYDNANFQGSPITKIVSGSHGDVTLYARYQSTVVVDPEPEKVTVNFNLDGGSGNATVQTINKGAKAVKPADPVKDGYTFDGWYLGASEFNFNTSVTNNLTLTAKWVEEDEPVQPVDPTETFTVTYELNGGSYVVEGYQDRNQMIEDFLTDFYNFLGKPGNKNDFIHGNGNFNGSYNSEDNINQLYDVNNKGVNPGNGLFINQTTHNAKWLSLLNLVDRYAKEVNEAQSFWGSKFEGGLRIKQFFRKDPLGADVEYLFDIIPSDIKADTIYEEYTIDSPDLLLPKVTKGGSTFEGWYTNANFTGNPVTKIDAGSTGNKKFYAKWGEVTTFGITYELNGGKFGGFNNRTEMIEAFLTDFYNFLDQPGGNLNTFIHGDGNFNGPYNSEENVARLYAVNNKGVDAATGMFINQPDYNKWVALLNLVDDFTKVNPDQTFWGSRYVGALRLKEFFRKNNVHGPLEEEYVQELFNRVPAGLSASILREYHAGSGAIKLPTPTRAGHTFEGWYTNAEFTGAKVTQINAGSTGDVKFYAKWSQPIYHVHFHLDGGWHGLFKDRNTLAEAFLHDLYSFIRPEGVSLHDFMHRHGPYNGDWYHNEDFRSQIYKAHTKTGDDNYFASATIYADKWVPIFNLMVNFVRDVNPDQDFWSDPHVGTIRLWQYLRNVKPASYVSDATMNMNPTTIWTTRYFGGSQKIILHEAVKEGYTFDGWWTEDFPGNPSFRVDHIAAGAHHDLNYYARWKKIETPGVGLPPIHTKYMTLNDCYRANQWIRVQGVMIHSTAGPGQMAASFFNRWNRSGTGACVHAFVDDREIWQYLPWNMRAWHAGGSANDTHIGIEICEPAGHYYLQGATMHNYNIAANAPYFHKAYGHAVALTIKLFKDFNLSVNTWSLLGHCEGYQRGMATNHGDPMHWFPKHGKSMNTFRADVIAGL